MRIALWIVCTVVALAWTGGGPNPHVARGVLSYVWNQIENGVGCPTG